MANISIAFILAKPNRTGSYPVRCRITISRKHAEFNTPFQVQSPADFDEVKQIFRKNKEGNARISIIRGELQTLFGQLMHDNPTAKDIKHKYLNSFEGKKSITALINDFVANKRANPDIKAQSVDIVEDHLKHLQNFASQAKMLEKRANEFALSDIEAFEAYLRGIRKGNGEPLRRRATIHQTASSLFKFGEEKGYIQSSPYKHFKIPKPKPTQRKDYLTIQETHALLNADVSALKTQQQYYLNLFLFSVLMGGISFADLQGMKAEHIKERSGRLWLVKHRQKVENSTGAKLETPFSELAKELYTKLLQYQPVKQQKKGLLLAMRSSYLSGITQAVKLLGIDKHITTHCSRTTFAHAMDMLGIKTNIIQASLGHTLSDTLHAHYLQIQDEPKIKAMDALAEAIKNAGTKQ